MGCITLVYRELVTSPSGTNAKKVETQQSIADGIIHEAFNTNLFSRVFKLNL